MDKVIKETTNYQEVSDRITGEYAPQEPTKVESNSHGERMAGND